MLLSTARQTLDDAIDVFAHGSYPTVEKADALAALILKRPCIISTGGYHNQVASRIAAAVNTGSDLIELCEAFAKSKTLFTPAENLDLYVFPSLVGVNDAGVALLARAKAHFARAYEVAA